MRKVATAQRIMSSRASDCHTSLSHNSPRQHMVINHMRRVIKVMWRAAFTALIFVVLKELIKRELFS